MWRHRKGWSHPGVQAVVEAAILRRFDVDAIVRELCETPPKPGEGMGDMPCVLSETIDRHRFDQEA